jgi:hypothetical protein
MLLVLADAQALAEQYLVSYRAMILSQAAWSDPAHNFDALRDDRCCLVGFHACLSLSSVAMRAKMSNGQYPPFGKGFWQFGQSSLHPPACTMDNWTEFAQALNSTTAPTSAATTADEALRLPVHLVVAFIGPGFYTLASLNKEWSAAYQEQYEPFQILHNTKCPKSTSSGVEPLWDCCPYGRPCKMRELPVSQWVKMRELLHDIYDRPFSQVYMRTICYDPCSPRHNW